MIPLDVKPEARLGERAPLNEGRPAGWLAAVLGGQARSPTGNEWWNGPMPTLASDQELLTRQAALQAEAAQVLAELDLGQLFADVGPVLVVGSYLSGLMCWRDLDVCLLAGVECSPSDLLELLKRVVELPGFCWCR